MADDNKPTPKPAPKLTVAEQEALDNARDAAARKKEEKAPTTRSGMGEKLFAKGGKTFKRGDDMKKSEMGMKKGGMHKMPDGKMMKNSAMNMGGMAGMKKGGMPMKDGKPAFMMGKKMNMGGMAKYASGGSVSARADGIASKGKTKGKMC